jgi:hypothetical protein
MSLAMPYAPDHLDIEEGGHGGHVQLNLPPRPGMDGVRVIQCNTGQRPAPKACRRARGALHDQLGSLASG